MSKEDRESLTRKRESLEKTVDQARFSIMWLDIFRRDLRKLERAALRHHGNSKVDMTGDLERQLANIRTTTKPLRQALCECLVELQDVIEDSEIEIKSIDNGLADLLAELQEEEGAAR